MNRFAASGIALVTTLLLGCANSPAARVVRVTDLKDAGELAKGQALVVEFHKGDSWPLVFEMQGPLLKTADDTPPWCSLRPDDSSCASTKTAEVEPRWQRLLHEASRAGQLFSRLQRHQRRRESAHHHQRADTCRDG